MNPTIHPVALAVTERRHCKKNDIWKTIFTYRLKKVNLMVRLIFHFLNHDSYWAKGRSEETIIKSIENSLCFGVYKDSQ